MPWRFFSTRRQRDPSSIRAWAVRRKGCGTNKLDEVVIALIYAATLLGDKTSAQTTKLAERLSGDGSAFESCTFACFFLDYYLALKGLDRAREIASHMMSEVVRVICEHGRVEDAEVLFDRRLAQYGERVRESGLESTITSFVNNLKHTLDGATPCRKEPIPILVIDYFVATELRIFITSFVLKVLSAYNDAFIETLPDTMR